MAVTVFIQYGQVSATLHFTNITLLVLFLLSETVISGMLWVRTKNSE